MTVEHMMYFALGFLIATIMALIVLPSVWKRAVRLTRKRIESATPITMAEFRADKDQLRARFALTQRRLERTIETLRSRLAEQLAELDRAQTDLAHARNERDRAVAVQSELEERNAAANQRIHELERELADLSQRLRAHEREIAELTSARQAAEAERLSAPRKSPIDSLRNALTLGDKETFEVLDGINDAYSRISQAGSSLNALLEQAGGSAGDTGETPAPSLAEELSQEEALEDLHRKISDVETLIEKDWGSESIDKTGLRNQLGDIATSVSRLIYADDSDAPDAEQSLFDRISKYAGENFDEPASPQAARQDAERKLHNLTGPTLSDRISAFRDIHINN